MGTVFGKIDPEHGYGFRAAGGISPTNPNLRPPSGVIILLMQGAFNWIMIHCTISFVLKTYGCSKVIMTLNITVCKLNRWSQPEGAVDLHNARYYRLS